MEEQQVNDKLCPAAEPNKRHPLLCSTRFRISLYIFFITTTIYLHRVNLSLAVVCMVDLGDRGSNPPLLHDASDVIADNDSQSVANGSGVFLYGMTDSIDSTTIALPVNDSQIEPNNAVSENTECSAWTKQNQDWTPELDWDKADVSVLLSSYFYGCVVTQIPAGAIADRVGGKHLMTAALAVTGACALLTPLCARTSIYLVFVVRILIGFGGGAVFPVGYAMITVWAPPSERGVLLSIMASGSLWGIIVSYMTSGLLCAYGFDNGWPSIFYIHGGVAVVCLVVWLYDSSSTPSSHPRISPTELEYICSTTKRKSRSGSRRIPWVPLLKSRALWAAFLTQFSFNWSFFTVLINVPMFLKEVLKFNITQNGLFSALPYLCCMVSILSSGKLAQILVTRRLLRVLVVHKLFTAASLLGSGVCLLFAGHLTCELRPLAVVLLCLASLFFGMAWGGLFINHPEFAGQYAGTALGITNAGGILAALLASMFAGLMTPNSSHSEWQTVFYIAAGVNLFGALIFSLCARADLEPWAAVNLDQTLTVDEKTLEIKLLNSTSAETEQNQTPT